MVVRRRLIVLLGIAAVLAAATAYLLPGLLGRPRASRPGQPRVREALDPSNNLLATLYLNPNLSPITDYEESPYPAWFHKDGAGSLETKPFTSTYHEELSPWLREWLQERYPALEKSPGDRKLLGKIVEELGARHFCSRLVPFADRFRAAGGELSLKAMGAYGPGLVRVGRVDDARKLYRNAVKRWGERATKNFAATLFKDLFHRAWIVDRDISAMLEAMDSGMKTSLHDHDEYYMLEVFSEHLRRASSNRELPWFLARMDKYWVWFPEDRIREALGLLRSAGITAPDSLRDAEDPLYRGKEAPPQAIWNRALASMNRGESDLALRQAEAAVDRSRSGDPHVHLEAVVILARVLRTREDLERAFAVTREYEQKAAATKAEDAIATSRIITGFMYERLADYRRAAEEYEKAREIGDRIGDDGVEWSARRFRARALCEVGMAEDVAPLLESMAKRSLQGGRASDSPHAFHSWGVCLSRMGRYGEAIEAFQTALVHAKKVIGQNFDIDHSTMLSCILEEGRAYLALKQYASAEKSFKEGQALAKTTRVDTASWPWQLGLARARRGQGDRAGAQSAIEECLRTIDGQRASLKDFQHRRTLNDNKYEAYALAIELALDRKDPAAAFSASEQARARAFLDELGAASGSGRPPAPTDLPGAIAAAGDTTLVLYFQLPDRLLAWVIRQGKAELVVLPDLGPERVAKSVGSFYRSLIEEERDSGKRQAALDESRRLRSLLWTPIAERIGPGERVCIVPHGVLHYVPFQALHDGSSFLIERHDLFYAASATTLVELRRRSPVPAASFFGLDSILSDDPSSPFAKTEILALRSQHPSGTFFLRDEATTEAFKTHAARAGIVHVSSHGFFNPWIPLDSGLVLSPESAGEARILRARDLYAMRFDKTSLVVMSACVSSIGDLAGGDEVTGLTRAFQVAGVPNVIGSLWPVDNRATTELMTDFHARLPALGDPVSALRAAQRQMSGKNMSIAKWAAFQVTGDGRPMTKTK